jgi:2,3,4,5-tetrahydropyridine-2,6-dicarboxylate N-succinyltransferase
VRACGKCWRMSLRELIESGSADRTTVARLLDALASGDVRAAERGADGVWHANPWVKQGILLGFRLGVVQDRSTDGTFRFFDKDTLPIRRTTLDDNVRLVPGGTTVRHGAYLAPGVICMPPAFVNIGAYVDEGAMIDSHALVGSCAQIGKRVHLSAAAQVGGVLEPINATPVVVEDDVLVGGGCGIYEGTVVRARAVLAPGTVLTGSTPVFDIVREQVYRRGPGGGGTLEIPSGAVVVPGARALKNRAAEQWGLSLYAPVIVKYRDERTDAATLLEEALR